MPSIAERTAYKVLENTGKSITELAIAEGASPTYATSGELTKTKAFQAVIAKFREKTAQQLVKHVNRSARELINKDLKNVPYEKLIAGIDTGIKNVQLLTGGATETHEYIPIIKIDNLHLTKIGSQTNNSVSSELPRSNENVNSEVKDEKTA